MKKIMILLALCNIFFSCSSQNNNTSSPTELDPIVQAAKEHSLYSDRVDWEKTNKEFIRLTGTQESLDDLKPGLEYLLVALGDKHGQFRKAEDFSFVAWYTGPSDPSDKRDPDFVNQVINDPNLEFSYALLDDNIGYLKVVGIGGNKTIEEHTAQIRDGLKDLASQNADKWILDLRFNGGGNMNPMIAGLAPLIGDGKIGGMGNQDGEITYDFEIKEGQFYAGQRLVAETDAEPQATSDDPLVVLLSQYTVSSGEILAVSLKGRPNTTFLGEPTGGYTTSNGYVQLRDDLYMMISESYILDRNGIVYNERVGVDQEMEFDMETWKEIKNTPAQDMMIQKAMEMMIE